MKAEWTTYLKSIGVQGMFFKRVEEVLDFYQELCPDQIEDIFITEYFDKDGNRQYESVWLFSSTSVMEAKQFLKEDDFDWAPLKQQVKYWQVKKSEYDFIEASTKSRAALHFGLLSGNSGTLRGSRENCNHLKALILKYIIPNAMLCPSSAQQEDALNQK